MRIAPSPTTEQIAEREAGERADQTDDQRFDHENHPHGGLAQPSDFMIAMSRAFSWVMVEMML